MSAVMTDLEHSCWTAEYLLAHCERYRVESNEGQLGYVEEVIWAPDGSEPLALRVRTGFGEGGLVTIMVGDVLELHPKRAHRRPRPDRACRATRDARVLGAAGGARANPQARVAVGPEALRTMSASLDRRNGYGLFAIELSRPACAGAAWRVAGRCP